MRETTVAVTGAWSYSGRFVASRLLRLGYQVVSFTNREVPLADPHGGRVRAIPFDFSPGFLTRALRGVDVLACAYWVRHDSPPVGHRGPWTSHSDAVIHSRRLVDAAVAAGVSRLVWTSIANPGLDPDLSYYAGKGLVECAVRDSGLPYTILRPACFFGPGALLVDNIAWASRHMPVFPLPAAPSYYIRPLHVGDYATAVADAVRSRDSYVRDACGPDRVEFGDLVRLIASQVGGRARVAWFSLQACAALYRAASFVLRETILTRDELVGLSRNRLDSFEAPLGRVSLLAWLRSRGDGLGDRFVREPRR